MNHAELQRDAGRIHLARLTRQLPERQRDQPRQHHRHQQRQQRERHRVLQYLHQQTGERLQRYRSRLQRHHRPAGGRHHSVSGKARRFARRLQLQRAVAVFVAAAQQRRQRFANQLPVLVIEHLTGAVEHVDAGAVAIVLLAKQRI